jgi:hypothetical protein
VTSGSQANGDTGLKIWITGLMALLSVLFRPIAMPSGMAMITAAKNPLSTVTRLVII